MALTAGLAPVVPVTSGSHLAGSAVGPHLFAPFGFMLVLLVGGALAYVLVRSTRDGHGTDQALETLRRRYASGHIDEEEFQRRKERLRG